MLNLGVLGAALPVLGLAAWVAVPRRPEQLRAYQNNVLLACVAIAAVFWSLRAAQVWQSRLLPAHCEGLTLGAKAVVTGLPQHFQSYGRAVQRVDLSLSAITPAHCQGPTRVRVYADAAIDLTPGLVTQVELRLKRPHGLVNPDHVHGEKRALIKGLHGEGSLRASTPVARGLASSSASAYFHRQRDRLSAWILREVGLDAGRLLTALAVGDTRYMEPEDWAVLRGFGLTHLFVISGLHVSMAAIPGWMFGRLLMATPFFGPPKLPVRSAVPYLMGLGIAGFYAALAGFTLPTQRALFMLCAAALPVVAGRPLSLSRSLALAAIGIVVLAPTSVLSSSFWLSFLAVLSISWILTWSRVSGVVWPLLRMQLLMQLFMLPISLLWFSGGAGLGGVVNVLAIPLVTCWVLPILLSALVLSIVGFSDWSATFLLKAAAAPLDAFWELLLRQPPEAFYSLPVRYELGVLACMSLLLGLLLLLLPAVVYRARLILVCLIMAGVLGVKRPPNSVSIDMLDVGQGTAVILRHGAHTILYDTGGGVPGPGSLASRVVLPVLHRQGVSKLDLLVISHSDMDHSAGEPDVHASLRVYQLRRGGLDVQDVPCRLGEQLTIGEELHLKFLSSGQAADTENNASCVVQVHAFGRSVLLPGDIDARRERELVAYWGDSLRSDLLMAGHHGSGASTSQLWLRKVSPDFLIASAGYRNRFGHPAPRIAKLAERERVNLLNTADHGAVSFEITPSGQIRCKVGRHARAAFWYSAIRPTRCETD